MSRHLRPSPARNRLRVALTLTTAGALVALSGGIAVGVPAENPNRQTICHATNSNHHPYVVNTPAKDGDVSGHAGHTGPLWSADLKAAHVSWGDIIPPFDYGDGQHFDGLNWSVAGQAIFANGCVLPPPALSLTVDKTNDANGDAAFHDSETASSVGADVAFHVTFVNTSLVTVVVDSVTDAVGATPIPITCAAAVVGTSLAPGASATCAFTVAGYSPANGSSTTNTATVTVHEGGDGDEGDADPGNTVSGSDTSVVTTTVPPPVLRLSVTKGNDANGDATYAATETSPSAGKDVPFRVVVTNTSAVTIALDGITDVVGAAAAVPLTCASALPTTLAAGASATCDFTLVGSSPAAGTSLTDTATATAHEIGDVEHIVTAQGASTVVTAEAPPATPDLSIVKTGPAASLAAGDEANYTLTVTNTGSVPASSVVVDDVVPAGTSLGDITAAGWTCSGDAVHCVLDAPLAAGGTAALTVTLVLDADYGPSSLTNTATVGPTDDTPDDNTSTVTTVITHVPDLSIVKTGPATVAAGGSITWALAVTNDGDAAAQVVTVTDSLADGLLPGTVTAVGWTCTGTTDLSCTLDADLAAGDNASLTISATIPADYSAATLSNTAVVGPTDATPDDNTSTVVTTVTQTSTGGGGGTVTPPATTPTTPTGFTGGGGSLAFTGAPITRWVAAAGALLLMGFGLLLAGGVRRGDRVV